MILDLQKLEKGAFLSSVCSAAESSATCSAFVFIPGYSVTFSEAVRRTAQIAFDLDFQGAPICYSWPSKGKYSGYPADEASIEWTEPHLLQLLEDLSSQKRIKTIHLIAHSMGNRALVRCLERISVQSAKQNPSFHQTVLAAPDIDAGVFENLAQQLGNVTNRVTLYASSGDLPLRWSRDFHGYRRAGDSGEGIVIVPGVDTIDASSVPTGFLGHSYYGDTRSLLSDIYELFKSGSPPPRFGLRPENLCGKRYWIFVP
jgi:esterase/lipase superfamily enzyme